MAKKRIQWLDFAKGLTILFVVILHSLPINSWILYIFDIFAMPIFFAISGYLYKDTDTVHKFKLMVYKKSTSLLLPYIFFSIILLVIHGIHHKSIQFIFSHMYNVFLVPINYLWFLYCLFFIFILVGFLDLIKINFKFQLIIYLFLSILQMLFPLYILGSSFNPIRGVFGYIFFFYCGYLLKKFHFLYLQHSVHLFLISLIIYIVSIIISENITGLSVDTDYIHYYTFVPKLLSIIIFFFIFINFRHNTFFKYFDKYGKYTLVIYLVHKPILSMHFHLFSEIINNNSFSGIIPHILLILFIWYICIFVCDLANHVPVINFLFYPRKYINYFIIKTKWGKNFFKIDN